MGVVGHLRIMYMTCEIDQTENKPCVVADISVAVYLPLYPLYNEREGWGWGSDIFPQKKIYEY